MGNKKDEIKAGIIANIGKGKYPGRLPSEIEMAHTFKVSRMTYRNAVKELVEEGHLVVRHGLGTFAATPLPKIRGNMVKLESMGQMIRFNGFTESEGMNRMTRTRASSELAAFLRIEPLDPVWRLERIRYADREPVAYSVNYMPRQRLGCAFEEGEFTGSLFRYLQEEAGIVIHCADTEITIPDGSTEMNQAALGLLDSQKGIMLLKQLHYDEFNVPILYSYDFLKNEAFTFQLRRRRFE